VVISMYLPKGGSAMFVVRVVKRIIEAALDSVVASRV
jgi:hypothetical protein